MNSLSLKEYVNLKRIKKDKKNLGVNYKTFLNICAGYYVYPPSSEKYKGKKEYIPTEESLNAISEALGYDRKIIDKLIKNGLQ